MYTVKTFKKGDILKSIQTSAGIIQLIAPRRYTYAIVDEAGNVLLTENKSTGKKELEIYPQKSTAQMMASFHNSKYAN